jgi:hypothetical protein
VWGLSSQESSSIGRLIIHPVLPGRFHPIVRCQLAIIERTRKSFPRFRVSQARLKPSSLAVSRFAGC